MLIPNTESHLRQSERQSIAFFIQPDAEFVVSPLPSISTSTLVPEKVKGGSPYEPVQFGDYLRQQRVKTYGV